MASLTAHAKGKAWVAEWAHVSRVGMSVWSKVRLRARTTVKPKGKEWGQLKVRVRAQQWVRLWDLTTANVLEQAWAHELDETWAEDLWAQLWWAERWTGKARANP